MFFHTLTIKAFRCFSDNTLYLGKYVTVLAGRNSTGKSTILGMLGNSTEMKKSIGRTYFARQFRAEFSELFKGSKDHDPIGPDKFTVSLADEQGLEIEKRQFRVAWQSPRKATIDNSESKQEQSTHPIEKKESQRTRFRIIPTYKDIDGKTRETKFDLPVYYLGLSRLFPIGEAKDESIRPARMTFTNDAHKNWFIETYNKILYLNDDIHDVSRTSIGETDNA